MKFLEGLASGALGVFIPFIWYEIAKSYSIGDFLKDLFLSEEAKLVAAANRFEAAEKNLKAKLFGKKK